MFARATRHVRCFFLSCLILASATRESSAQIQAFVGKPFGVARVTVPLDADTATDPAQDDRFVIQDDQNRVFYFDLPID